MNSRHLTGDAIDIVAYVGGSIRWDWPLYEQLAIEFKQAATELGVSITWGVTGQLSETVLTMSCPGNFPKASGEWGVESGVSKQQCTS